jgi:hypothetical protein
MGAIGFSEDFSPLGDFLTTKPHVDTPSQIGPGNIFQVFLLREAKEKQATRHRSAGFLEDFSPGNDFFKTKVY